MRHCAAEAAVPPANFKDESPVSEDQFWRWGCTDCAHICLGCFQSKSHNGLISPRFSLPSVLSYMTAKHCKYCILFCSLTQTWDEKCTDFILLRTSESSPCFAASHRPPTLALMFICTPSIPPFVMSCFIPTSISQLCLSLGIALRLITFQEFSVMTGGQANFWSDKWLAKWLQSAGRQMVLELPSEVAAAFSVMAHSDNVEERGRQRLSLRMHPRNKVIRLGRVRLLLLFFWKFSFDEEPRL